MVLLVKPRELNYGIVDIPVDCGYYDARVVFGVGILVGAAIAMMMCL